MRPLTNQVLTLDDTSHVYRLASEPGRQFTSVTEFIGSFFEPFDGPAIAAKLCAEHERYRGRTPEDLLAEWQLSGETGTLVHDEVEAYVHHRTSPEHPKAIQACRWIDRYLPRERFVLTTELRLYSAEHNLAGTTDILALDRETGWFLEFDWKTNKKIDRTPYQGKRGIRGPGLDIPDCHFTKYGLQLSTYAFILETEYGVSPKHLGIVHLTESGAETIPVEYDRGTVEAMLKWRRQNGGN